MPELPYEIIYNITSFCDLNTKLRCEQVSPQWKSNVYWTENELQQALIRAIIKNDLSDVEYRLRHPKLGPEICDDAVKFAARVGNEMFELIVNDARVDPSADDNVALRFAVRRGNSNLVRRLLSDPRVDPGKDPHRVIRCAAMKGHTEVVRILMDHPGVGPRDSDSALSVACRNGHLETVRLLLKNTRVSCRLWSPFQLRMASEHGHVQVVKCLLEDSRFVPSTEALDVAVSGGHDEVVKILLAEFDKK